MIKTRKVNQARRGIKKMAGKYGRSVKGNPLKTIGVVIGLGTLSNILWHQFRK